MVTSSETIFGDEVVPAANRATGDDNGDQFGDAGADLDGALVEAWQTASLARPRGSSSAALTLLASGGCGEVGAELRGARDRSAAPALRGGRRHRSESCRDPRAGDRQSRGASQPRIVVC